MKKILIYDSSHAYLAWLKRKFKTNYEITNYAKTDRKQLNLASFEAVLFVINNEEELIDLMYVYTFVDNLFVSTTCKKINKRLNDIEKITILNYNNSKKMFTEQIEFWLNALEFNKQKNKLLQSEFYA